MARMDQITGKRALSGNTRSKALNASRRKWNLNLQKTTIKTANGSSITIRVSARTLKTLKKNNLLG